MTTTTKKLNIYRSYYAYYRARGEEPYFALSLRRDADGERLHHYVCPDSVIHHDALTAAERAGHPRLATIAEAIDYLSRSDDGDVRGYLPLRVARREGIRASRHGVTVELSAAEVREATDWRATAYDSETGRELADVTRRTWARYMREMSCRLAGGSASLDVDGARYGFAGRAIRMFGCGPAAEQWDSVFAD